MSTMETDRFEKYQELALAAGAAEAKLIPARDIVIAEWVGLKCRYGCPGYDKRHTCPPRTPTPSEFARVLADYRHALLYVHEGKLVTKQRIDLHQSLADLERTAFLDGFYKAFGLGAGPCRMCEICDLTSRCKHPYVARPSMESCGIDVYATCRKAGIRLEVVTREDGDPRFVHLLLLE